MFRTIVTLDDRLAAINCLVGHDFACDESAGVVFQVKNCHLAIGVSALEKLAKFLRLLLALLSSRIIDFRLRR